MMFRSCALVSYVLMLAVRTAAEEDVVCEPLSDASCKLSAGSGQASLLQKVSKTEKKTSMHSHTEQEQPAPEADTSCTGISRQGKCWYLSELGESCSAMCSRQGKTFSYAALDDTHPITPALVGHEPSLKQEPWAALECYVPSEDRYHTASTDPASDTWQHTATTDPKSDKYVNEVGAWKHESCKLACPCSNSGQPAQPAVDTTESQCSWTQPPACAPEFEWKGQVYSGCAVVDMAHDRPWCQHGYGHTEYKDAAQDWSFCSYNCVAPTPAPIAPIAPTKHNCQWLPTDACMKEFDYKGVHYKGCVWSELDSGTAWCSKTDLYSGSWDSCTKSCEEETDDVLCSWQAGPECPGLFEYKGVEYSGCTTLDNPTPWCSHDRVHKGSWTTCQKICSKPNVPVAPTPVAPAPVPAPAAEPKEDNPCERHLDAENDLIGSTVALDEAGYKVAASAENSPINMKRFVCRVVGKIDCRITDLPSLMAFVPYYSGLISQQTYMHLEAELATLCHAGGKWIIPIDTNYWNAP